MSAVITYTLWGAAAVLVPVAAWTIFRDDIQPLLEERQWQRDENNALNRLRYAYEQETRAKIEREAREWALIAELEMAYNAPPAPNPKWRTA